MRGQSRPDSLERGVVRPQSRPCSIEMTSNASDHVLVFPVHTRPIVFRVDRRPSRAVQRGVSDPRMDAPEIAAPGYSHAWRDRSAMSGGGALICPLALRSRGA